MSEKENVKVEKKAFGKYFYIILAVLVSLTVGYLLGLSEIKTNKDLSISVDYDKQVFRDNIGKKIYPIEYRGNLYLPFNELGSYLNYMTIVDSENNKIDLISLEDGVNTVPLENMNTKNYKGEEITNKVFSNADYNIMIIWASWCPDCKNLFSDIRDNAEYFKSDDLQLLSVVVDEPIIDIPEDFKNKVYEISEGVPFDEYVLRSGVEGTVILGNSVSIPKIVIFDNEGRLIKKIDDMSCDTLIEVLDYIR